LLLSCFNVQEEKSISQPFFIEVINFIEALNFMSDLIEQFADYFGEFEESIEVRLIGHYLSYRIDNDGPDECAFKDELWRGLM
jgi:hypothetical protein